MPISRRRITSKMKKNSSRGRRRQQLALERLRLTTKSSLPPQQGSRSAKFSSSFPTGWEIQKDLAGGR